MTHFLVTRECETKWTETIAVEADDADRAVEVATESFTNGEPEIIASTTKGGRWRIIARSELKLPRTNGQES